MLPPTSVDTLSYLRKRWFDETLATYKCLLYVVLSYKTIHLFSSVSGVVHFFA